MNTNVESKLIFIEGTDRSGKGSLMTAIHKATDYKHVIFDRGVLSNKVYSEAFNRLNEELLQQYDKLEDQIAETSHVVLYLHCDIDELEKRRAATNHEEIDFKYHQSLFAKHMENSKLKIYPLDTTVMSPDAIAQMLVNNGII